MNRLLLLGAGFSRNWGGWLANEVFEYLLGDSAIVAHPELRMRLWRAKNKGGFELTLEQLQREARSGSKVLLLELESAITRMFEDMNDGFSSVPPFKSAVRDFLFAFDAIFTVNQDLLLERHYFVNDFARTGEQWESWQMPGMRPKFPNPPNAVAIPNYIPDDTFQIRPRSQPYFKLHGSSNWKTTPDGRLIIAMGGGKSGVIESTDVLKQYFQHFRSELAMPNTRLMIIGFGFKDQHIKDEILSAAAHGLKIFIVDPCGVDVASDSATQTNPFADCIVGASRRPLGEVMRYGGVERRKIDRFLKG